MSFQKSSAASLGALALAAAAFAPALLPLAAQAQNVAIVNGKAVPKARVEALLNQATRQGQPRTPELEQQVRDEVVLREMFVQEAEKRGLQATPEYKTQMELARQGILIRELFNEYQKSNKASDADVQAEYDRVKAQQGGTEYHARHILVEKEDDAKALIEQLKAGAKFEELAKKNSKDPGSGENGGDLDWAPAGAYVPEFSQAMAKLKKGETTDSAGEDAVRLARHQARRHARGEVPEPRRGAPADRAAPRAEQDGEVPRRGARTREDRLQVRGSAAGALSTQADGEATTTASRRCTSRACGATTAGRRAS